MDQIRPLPLLPTLPMLHQELALMGWECRMTLTDAVMEAMDCSNAYCNNAQVVVTK